MQFICSTPSKVNGLKQQPPKNTEILDLGNKTENYNNDAASHQFVRI